MDNEIILDITDPEFSIVSFKSYHESEKVKCRVEWCGLTENICPKCGYCKYCHCFKDLEGSCASKIEWKQSDLFAYENDGSEDKLKIAVCQKCGSTSWIVGQGSYYTAIKCPNCEYEIGVHDG